MVKATKLRVVTAGDLSRADRVDAVWEPYPEAEQAVLRRVLDFVSPLYTGHRTAGNGDLLPHVIETAVLLAQLKLDHEALSAAMKESGLGTPATRAQS